MFIFIILFQHVRRKRTADYVEGVFHVSFTIPIKMNASQWYMEDVVETVTIF